MEHLSIKDIHDRLAELGDWELIGNEITKDFNFNDSKEAMEFAQKTGEEAERLHHFPDIIIRNNRVTINLTTHEANGLTHNDFKLAKIIEQLI
ncbi:MAG: 4a-hydroxytetrahydrobiopterin dehydratase [Nanoarchaeota archaeon]|nr:4a-hydroxytetrahydrobiopterin dehydratase [Nanoarchaeota archaeon]